MRQLYSVKNERLGITFKPAKGQPFVQDGAHYVAVACGTEEFQPQQGAHGASGGDHLRAGETDLCHDPIEGNRSQHGEEEKQAAELRLDPPRAEVEFADIGDLRRDGACAQRSLVIATPRKPCEAFFLQDFCDSHRAERMAILCQRPADVIDREVLLAEGDDLWAKGIRLGRGLGTMGRGLKKVTVGPMTELMDQHAKTARRVAETGGGLGTGNCIHEIGAQRLVLSVGGIGRLKEEPGLLDYLIDFTD